MSFWRHRYATTAVSVQRLFAGRPTVKGNFAGVRCARKSRTADCRLMRDLALESSAVRFMQSEHGMVMAIAGENLPGALLRERRSV